MLLVNFFEQGHLTTLLCSAVKCYSW